MTMTPQKNRPLTDKQIAVLEYFVEYVKHNLYQPTMRELADMVGISSLTGIDAHIKALIVKGWLEKGEQGQRALIITEKTRKAYGLFWI